MCAVLIQIFHGKECGGPKTERLCFQEEEEEEERRGV